VFSQAFINLDGRLFENAQVLGMKPFRRFFDIVLPLMRYAVFSAFVVCFTMIFTDYGIPLSVGGTYTILATQFYKNVIGLLDFSAGAIYGILILLPAAVLYIFDILYFGKKQHTSKTNRINVRTGRFHPIQIAIFSFISIVIAIVIAIVVVAPFIRAWPYDKSMTFVHFQKIMHAGMLSRLIFNSVVMSLCTGIFGALISLIAGYIYVRDQNGLMAGKKLMHGLYMTALAVPGLALGLSYALFFKGTFMYNTLMIMVIVNIIHFIGSPYMMAVSHFKLLNPNLEAICRTLGGNVLNVLVDVIIPNSKKMLLDVFVYFFTNTMVTISAISLLYSAQRMTLSLQITAFNGQGMWESALAVSLIILCINIIAKIWQNLRPDIDKPKEVHTRHDVLVEQ
jgi:iron(III) transport system permease protein